MQILHSTDPSCDLFGFLISMLNRVNIHGSGAHNILALNVLQLEHSLVLVVQGRLVKHCDTKILLGSIRLVHFQESINFANSWNEIGNEWLEFCKQIDLLRLESVDIFEQLFYLPTYLQVCVLSWVISTRYFFFIFFFLLVLRTGLLLLLSWLLCLSRCLLLLLWLLLLLCLFYIHINIDLILFFLAIYLFAVIHIDRQVEGLVLNLLSFNLSIGCWLLRLFG